MKSWFFFGPEKGGDKLQSAGSRSCGGDILLHCRAKLSGSYEDRLGTYMHRAREFCKSQGPPRGQRKSEKFRDTFWTSDLS